MRVELRLARAENEFLAESVTFADPDHRWERSFAAVKENCLMTVLVMPEELGPAPKSVSVHAATVGSSTPRCRKASSEHPLSRYGMASRATARAARRTWSNSCAQAHRSAADHRRPRDFVTAHGRLTTVQPIFGGTAQLAAHLSSKKPVP
jgi:hypothetical protein